MSSIWVFNIRQENWDACALGPTNRVPHGEKNLAEPWHGIGENSPASPYHLKEGDLVIARRTYRHGPNPHGVLGIWRFYDYNSVSSQNDVPWSDNHYEWVLYCRPVQREFELTFQENFDDLPFTGQYFQASVRRLDPSYESPYIEHICHHDSLSAAAKVALKAHLG